MNKKFLTMAGVVAVLGAGTFWGLEIFDPHKVDEAKFPPSVSVDQVFANKLNPDGASDQSVAAANAAAVATPAGSDTTAAESPAAASGDNAATAAASAATANPSSTAAEPSGSEATATAAPAATSEPAASEPAQTSSSPAESAVATAEPVPAATADTATSAPAESSESAAPAEAAPAAKPAPAKKHATHAAKPAHHAAATSSTKAKHSRWWPAENPANLSLVYAGPASFKKAIVLMFNGAFFQADGLDQNLKVTDKSGHPVSGSWAIGENNRRMLVFPVPGDGQYKVSISTGLTDSKGRKIAHSLNGPVTVR
ncbi:MAG: hypothetical protein ACRETM_07065 [Stenotrophobium sp.]